MKSILRGGAALALLLATGGCGAIFNGTRQTIQANSAPSAAQIRTEPGNLQFTTPASLNLERKHDYVLTFTKEGYSSATFQIQKSLQGGILVLDILFTGLIGVIVDAATGAWYKLSPEAASVSLERVGASVDGPDRIDVWVSPNETGFRIEASEPGVKVEVRPQSNQKPQQR